MRYKKYSLTVVAIIALTGCANSINAVNNEILLTENTKGHVPIPAAELNLPTAVADKYFKVSDHSLALESPVFDRDGNLFFVSIYENRIYKLDSSLNMSIFFEDKNLFPAGLAINRTGDFLIASVGNLKTGTVSIVSKQGRKIKDLVPKEMGFLPDDLGSVEI